MTAGWSNLRRILFQYFTTDHCVLIWSQDSIVFRQELSWRFPEIDHSVLLGCSSLLWWYYFLGQAHIGCELALVFVYCNVLSLYCERGCASLIDGMALSQHALLGRIWKELWVVWRRWLVVQIPLLIICHFLECDRTPHSGFHVTGRDTLSGLTPCYLSVLRLIRFIVSRVHDLRWFNWAFHCGNITGLVHCRWHSTVSHIWIIPSRASFELFHNLLPALFKIIQLLKRCDRRWQLVWHWWLFLWVLLFTLIGI